MTAAVLRRGRALGPALLAVATGGVLLRLVLTGAHTAYVRASTGWLLVTAGGVLVVAGLSGLARAAEGHVQGHTLPRAAALLLVPLALLVVVSPPSLGVYYARHAGADAVATSRSGDDTPLPAGAGPRVMTLREALRRSSDGATLRDRPLVLTGFASGTDADGRVLLTRMAVRCCAADAVPLTVAVVPPPDRADAPVEGTWLQATVEWEGGKALFEARALLDVDEPDDPYESS